MARGPLELVPSRIKCTKPRSHGLWVVTCYFNPCNYASRRENYRRFRAELARQRVPVLLVELAASDAAAHWTKDSATRYLRVLETDVLWAKERLLNLGIAALPAKCTAVCWCDCDVLFARDDWATACVERLKRHRVVQPFGSSVFLAPDETPERHCRYRPSISMARHFVQHTGRRSYSGTDQVLVPHPGYAWAARREVLARIGGLYDRTVLGHGDLVMGLAFCHDPRRSELPAKEWEPHWDPGWSRALLKHARAWQRRAADVVQGDVGFVHGAIYHLWHGPPKRRQYHTRGAALAGFDPAAHVAVAPSGALRWTAPARAAGIPDQVQAYFASRREDIR